MRLLNAIDKLGMWKRGGKRAPHKPLLLLYALAKHSQGNSRFGFAEIENDIHELLNEFWNPRPGKHHVNDPFWRLQKDKIWKVESTGEIRLDNSGSALVSDLKRYNATGFFPPDIVREIREEPDSVLLAVRKLLDDHFPESLHHSILERVGLSMESDPSRKSSWKARRDPKFRENVLHAYGYSCAVCGFDLRIKTLPVGIEAAHIKWHQSGGPDTEDNGLALCATHHRLLDYGALTLSEDYAVVLSDWISGHDNASSFIEEHRERKIRLPRNEKDLPREDYIRWHREQVFKEPAIESST